jgi:thiol-disulfide isomerase/thioredoxin
MRLILALITVAALQAVATAQPVSRVTARQLKAKIDSPGDSIRIFNFWATWCGPCVKEMPLFEAYRLAHPEVQLFFVSLDLQLDPDPAKVSRFATRKKLTGRVLILDEGDPNGWIDTIDKRWSGAIPATLVVNPRNGRRAFEEKEFKTGELDALVNTVK